MDSKKRKVQQQQNEEEANHDLSVEDVRKLLEPFTKEELLQALSKAAASHVEVLEDVRKVADANPASRKLFVASLSYETTLERLKQVFSKYGDIESAVILNDKATGKSRGYGFLTFKHADSAIRALKEPSKKIDGRTIITQLASAGSRSGNLPEQSNRKIFVGGVFSDVDTGKLINLFSKFGEIEEGPVGLDVSTGKPRGFAIFVYKTVEGARRALEQPIKLLDGRELQCRAYVVDSMKQRGEGVSDSIDLALLQAGNAAGATSITYQNALGAAQVLGSVLRPGLGLGSSLVLPPYTSTLSLAPGLGTYPSVLGASQSAYGTALGPLYNVPMAQPFLWGGDALEGSQVARAAGARLP